MRNLKIKTIGVLKERKNDASNEGIRKVASGKNLAEILHSRSRREWVTDWLRKNQTQFMSQANLQREMRFRTNESYPFSPFFHITNQQFTYLVTGLAPAISGRSPQRWPKEFSAEERLSMTLKYLATGEIQPSYCYGLNASRIVIVNMIGDICRKIYDLLKDQYVCAPETVEGWDKIEDDFERKTYAPMCRGNLTMQEIKFDSSYYIDQTDMELRYRARSPLIFTAIVDSKNNFIYVDLEQTTAQLKNEIFLQSRIIEILRADEFAVLAENDEEESVVGCSSYFVGPATLPLRSYLMTAVYYDPERQNPNDRCKVFHRHGVCYCDVMDDVNRHAPNALRILSNIFPIFGAPLCLDIVNARKIILGCVALYNYLRKTDKSFFKQSQRICGNDEYFVDEEWEEEWVEQGEQGEQEEQEEQEQEEEEEEGQLEGDAEGQEIEQIYIDDNDDCILVYNYGQLLELNPNRACVSDTNCFQDLTKQKHETDGGQVKKKWLETCIEGE